jgi:pimeloyl-ACP methyl ester carboxylesterase
MPQIRANGIDIEYESFGRTSDPLILMIMGLGAQLIFWPESLCHGLAAKGFRVVRFDNRDIGMSTHLDDCAAPDFRELFQEVTAGRTPKVPYSLSDMADDALGLMSAIGVERAHIVGGSMGGMIAQLIAIHNPDKTKSLTSIMSTTGRRDLPQGDPAALAQLAKGPASSRREDLIENGVNVRHALAGPGFPSTETEIRALVERVVDRAPYDPAGVARQWAAVVAASPRNAVLNSVRCPALVLHGDSDPLFPVAAAKDTADSIPSAKLVIVPGMGHGVPESLAPILLKRIGDFVTKAEGQAPFGG